MSRRRGFTLLEVLVSLAILGLALGTIAGINATSFESSNYARGVTVATLLARSKMLDVEEELRKDGFGDTEKEFSGDFSEEGYPSVEWAAVCRPVELDVGQLVGGLFGGDISPEALPDKVQGFLQGMGGGGGADLGKIGELAGAAGQSGAKPGDLASMLGGDGMEGVFKQIGETLGKSIREITLEIKWGKKNEQESITFVQYVTTTGRLAVPNSAQGLPGALTPAALGGLINPNQPLPGDRNANTLQVPPLPGQGKIPTGEEKGISK